jgi:hypothetical protein
MEIDNLQQTQKKATLENLCEMIIELQKEEQATQRAISAIRGDITDLYSFYKNHKCYIVE